MKTLIIESSILIKADNNFISGPTPDAADRHQQKIQEALDNYKTEKYKEMAPNRMDPSILSHNTNHTLVECNNSTRLILVDTLILQ